MRDSFDFTRSIIIPILVLSRVVVWLLCMVWSGGSLLVGCSSAKAAESAVQEGAAGAVGMMCIVGAFAMAWAIDRITRDLQASLKDE